VIPRTRANFSPSDLVRAALTNEAHDAHRRRARALLASYHSTTDCLLTPSGRGALYAILRALPDRPRVIVPAYTCNAVIEAAKLAGKRVVYADAEPDGFNTTTDAYREIVSSDAIVIATHQFGIPCEIERTVELCRSRNAFVVEDCAAALGTRVRGNLAGTFGDAAFFSFDCSKLVNVPMKGGAVIAKDRAVFDAIRSTYSAEIKTMPGFIKARYLAMAAALLSIQRPHPYKLFHHWQFQRRKVFTAESNTLNSTPNAFYRFDFTEWQAAVLNRQLERLDELVVRRRLLYAHYLQGLRGAQTFELPPEDENHSWACIRFPIRIHPLRANRAPTLGSGGKVAFYESAVARGVDFAFSFTFLQAPSEMKRAHTLADSVLDLPFYHRLDTEEADLVIRTLLSLDAERSAADVRGFDVTPMRSSHRIAGC